MTSAAVERLLAIVARLRSEDGCSWDRAQTLASLAPRLVEEAYEALEFAEAGESGELCVELGDLLFVMMLCARIADEDGRFGFADVAAAAADKLERRHPRIFGRAHDPGEEAPSDWETQKAEERRLRAAANGRREPGALEGVARGLPALTRSIRLQDRAARVGFDWPELGPVLDKVEEEIAELQAELPSGAHARLEHELGDILLAVTNVARHIDVDPERALRRANERFESRFACMEALAEATGRRLADFPLEEQEALWQRAKRELEGGDTG
ncbi:MAG: nucleoside triphosphate pyrophosphohydrolase [Gammaproteobacteria bacterium]|jgi:MazG family protein|nr:nucleoside triphosphate pyrophosphohydrolase [Gammaproteobacteria bacterium]